MKFHTIILQPDGRVTGRRLIDSATRFSNNDSRRIVRRCAEHFRTSLSDDRFQIRSFGASIGEPGRRCLMEWVQAEPLSAMVTFLVDRKPALLSILLTGFVPEVDAAVVKATRETLPGLFEDVGLDPGPGLAEIPERPAVVDIPCQPAMPSKELFPLTSLSSCVGVAFFQHAEICFENIQAEFPRQCSRKRALSAQFTIN
jgi:hypothetical protein